MSSGQGKAPVTSTHVIRAAEARRNEDLVLADNSLRGERRASWARLAMFALFGASQELFARVVFHHPPTFDLARTLVVVSYAALTVANLVQIHRAPRGVPSRAQLYPILANLVDFGFLTFMAIRSWQIDGRIYPEMGAISMGMVLCFSVARFDWRQIALSTVMASCAYLVAALVTHVFDPVSTPFVLGGFQALGILLAMTNRSSRDTFTALRRRDNLIRFLPRQVADRVLEHGESALRPVQVEVTVLFSDIRDFTTFSEALAPRDVLEFLDEYFGQMSQVVKGHDGLVNKFLGDGMLAFWGVPDRAPEHATLALKAALDMRRVLEELNRVRSKRGERPVRFGVGIHTGTVAAGMLGGADQHEYTIIGDAVNVASRIEGLTKSLGCDILVSETTWQKTGGRFRGRRIAEEKVKGRTDPVVVYAVDDTDDAAAARSA